MTLPIAQATSLRRLLSETSHSNPYGLLLHPEDPFNAFSQHLWLRGFFWTYYTCYELCRISSQVDLILYLKVDGGSRVVSCQYPNSYTDIEAVLNIAFQTQNTSYRPGCINPCLLVPVLGCINLQSRLCIPEWRI